MHGFKPSDTSRKKEYLNRDSLFWSEHPLNFKIASVKTYRIFLRCSVYVRILI